MCLCCFTGAEPGRIFCLILLCLKFDGLLEEAWFDGEDLERFPLCDPGVDLGVWEERELAFFEKFFAFFVFVRLVCFFVVF